MYLIDHFKKEIAFYDNKIKASNWLKLAPAS